MTAPLYRRVWCCFTQPSKWRDARAASRLAVRFLREGNFAAYDEMRLESDRRWAELFGVKPPPNAWASLGHLAARITDLERQLLIARLEVSDGRRAGGILWQLQKLKQERRMPKPRLP